MGRLLVYIGLAIIVIATLEFWDVLLLIAASALMICAYAVERRTRSQAFVTSLDGLKQEWGGAA